MTPYTIEAVKSVKADRLGRNSDGSECLLYVLHVDVADRDTAERIYTHPGCLSGAVACLETIPGGFAVSATFTSYDAAVRAAQEAL